jgi:transcriptional regulator with XRE-family HTH domain
MATSAYPDDCMTQSEVAARMQVSPQRIGQIERSAFAKIRAAIATGAYPAIAEDTEGRLSRALSQAKWSASRRRERDARRVRRKKSCMVDE